MWSLFRREVLYERRLRRRVGYRGRRVGEAAHPGPGGAPTTAERVSQLEVLERELTRLEGYAQHTRGAVREEDEAAADHLRQALAHLLAAVSLEH